MSQPEERYEYVKAIIDCGELRWEYKLPDGPVNTMTHDEDVSDYSEDDIKDITRSMLGLEDDEEITVEYC